MRVARRKRATATPRRTCSERTCIRSSARSPLLFLPYETKRFRGGDKEGALPIRDLSLNPAVVSRVH